MFGRFAWWHLDVVFFLDTSPLHGIRVEAKPRFFVFDTTPLEVLARYIQLLFATRQDVAKDDLCTVHDQTDGP